MEGFMEILTYTPINQMALLIFIQLSIPVFSYGQDTTSIVPAQDRNERNRMDLRYIKKPYDTMRVPGFESETHDHLIWEDSVYCINKSPMSYFDGYKEFEYPNMETEILHVIVGGIPSAYTKSIDWAIIDSILYLCDVRYRMKEENPSEYEKRHLPLEKFTGIKFASPVFQVPDTLKNRINPNGVMQAQWFSDTLYIKPPIFCNERYGWLKENGYNPYYIRLIFREGKITEIEKTMVEDDNILVYPKHVIKTKK